MINLTKMQPVLDVFSDESLDIQLEEIGDATLLRESGHVIGGSTVLIESKGKRLFCLLVSIHVGGSRMLREADLDIGDIDLRFSLRVHIRRKAKFQELNQNQN